MPYYVYALHGFGRLEPLGAHERYADASAQAKALRAAAAGDAPRVRVMFAASALEAEDLLLQVRDPHPPGDDA